MEKVAIPSGTIPVECTAVRPLRCFYCQQMIRTEICFECVENCKDKYDGHHVVYNLVIADTGSKTNEMDVELIDMDGCN